MKCPTCRGHGVVYYPDGEDDCMKDICEDCDGTGEKPEPDKEQK